MLDELKRDVLFNFNFLQCKLNALGYRSVLSDCLQAAEAFPEDAEIRLLLNFLKISGTSLEIEASQLPYQLVGRLFNNTTSSPLVAELLDAARKSSTACFYPNRQCLEAPGGAIYHSLVGHTKEVHHVSFSKDGQKLYSAGDDGIMIWNLGTGALLQEIEGCYLAVYPYQSSKNDECVIAVETNIHQHSVVSHELRTGNSTVIVCYTQTLMSEVPPSTDVSKDGKYFVLGNGKDVFILNLSEVKIHRQIENEARFLNKVIAGKDAFAYTHCTGFNKLCIGRFSDDQFKCFVPTKQEVFAFTPYEENLVVLVPPEDDASGEGFSLNIYDGGSGALLQTFKGKGKPGFYKCNCTHFCYCKGSFSGQSLALIGGNRVNFWNVETGMEQVALKTATDYKQAAVSGHLMVVLPRHFRKSPLQVYDLKALELPVVGEEHVTSANQSLVEIENEISKVLISQSGDVCVTIAKQGSTFQVWDPVWNRVKRRVTLQGLQADKSMLLDDQRIMVWDKIKKVAYVVDLETGTIICHTKEEVDFEDFFVPFNNLWDEGWKILDSWTFIRENNELLTFNRPTKTFRAFDLSTGECTGTIDCSLTRDSFTVIFSCDGSTMVTMKDGYCSSDGDKDLEASNRVYDTQSRKKILEIKDDLDTRTKLTEDGKFLCHFFDDRSYRDCYVRIWDTSTGKQIQGQVGHEISIEDSLFTATELHASSSNGCVIVSWNCGHLLIFDLHTGERLSELKLFFLPEEYFPEISMTQSSNSKEVLIQLSEANEIQLYDLSDLKNKKKKEPRKVASFKPEGKIQFSEISKDGRYICVQVEGVCGITTFQLCGTDDRMTRSAREFDVDVKATEIKINANAHH